MNTRQKDLELGLVLNFKIDKIVASLKIESLVEGNFSS